MTTTYTWIQIDRDGLADSSVNSSPIVRQFYTIL